MCRKCCLESSSLVSTLLNMIKVAQMDLIPLDQLCLRRHFNLVKQNPKK